jgi:site-specific recombinase XerD
LGSRQADCDLCSLIASKIEELESNNQFGTASSYDVTRKSFLKFMADIYPKKKIIHLGDIDILFLNAYKNWMTKQGRSNTTIGIYLRNIRHIFNSAIQKGITGTDSYPFGRGKTKIPAGRALKKALSKEELNKLFHFSVENNSQQQIVTLVLNSVLLGMNLGMW